MTKKDIVRRIADELGRHENETAVIVPKILDAIIAFLATEGRVELRNFGVFEVRRRQSRPARNPKTGEKVMVGERFTVKFKPGRRSRNGWRRNARVSLFWRKPWSRASEREPLQGYGADVGPGFTKSCRSCRRRARKRATSVS